MKHWMNGWFLLSMAFLLWAAVSMAKNASLLNYRNLLARPRASPALTVPYGLHKSQFGELWLPQGAGHFPVAVLVHGGCWLAALPGLELMAYMAEDLRSHGIAAWNIEYRRLGEDGAGYPGTFSDVADALDYLRVIAPKHGLDLSHTAVIGHSAGGQLALWLAGRTRIGPASPLYRADPLPVQAVVTLAGINDLASYRRNGPGACGGPSTIDRLIGVRQRQGQDAYADTSPAAMLPIGVRQLIVSGASDPIVPARFGQEYAMAAQKAGDRADEMTIDAAGHFELIDPQSEAWARIRPWLLARLKPN